MYGFQWRHAVNPHRDRDFFFNQKYFFKLQVAAFFSRRTPETSTLQYHTDTRITCI